jgi:RimJ/RimL family protein N-acetyltransferase
MRQLAPEQYELAQALFSELTTFHFSVGAVLAGTARGEIWVDDPIRPRVGYAITTEGDYLTGDVGQESSYAELKEIIPHDAYLVVCPDGWKDVLDRIWNNRFARRHSRRNFRFQQPLLSDWRSLVPAGFQLVAVDRDLLRRTELRNYQQVASRVDEWYSIDYFLQHGFGYCLLHDDTIVSRCIADCVVGNKCEMGVGTDMNYRKRGLATAVVAATVDHCLARGFTDIGWHCLTSNAGSMALAEKVGFAGITDYYAYSSELPSENSSDLTSAEYRDWAEHYERASDSNLRYAFYAAGAWSLAGSASRALANLQRLVDGDWQGRPEWLEDNWMFVPVRDMPEFKTVLAEMHARRPGEAG